MNHLDFFGLREDPFRLTPDRNFYFPTRGHTALGEVIRYGLEEGEGFIIITGEVGCGKTLLLRLMMDQIDDNRFETALILSPHLSPRELLFAILHDLGLPAAKHSKASLYTLLRLLNDHLSTLAQQGKKLLIVIDEAQNLPDKSLEQLRLLSNFETDTQKLLQIVLFGQPELRTKLAQASLRQFVQRVSIMENLTPLTKGEMSGYIRHRLKKSGGNEIPFSIFGAHLLWRHTRGYPRLINKVMSRALMVACAAGKTTLSGRIIREAAASFNTPERFILPGGIKFRRSAVLIMVLLLLLAAAGIPDWLKSRDVTRITAAGTTPAGAATTSPERTATAGFTLKNQP
ncbi:MAG: AAA family ATPase [Desulfurivibrionaceae bacterium]